MRLNTNLNLPEEIVFSLKEGKENIIRDMKKTVAVKYYKEKKLTLGQSSELAEMTRENFIGLLSDYNISLFNYESNEDVLEDLEGVRSNS